MQKNVQINADVFIEDLKTGHSYVNFDRRAEVVTDEQTGQPRNVIITAEQYRVTNPATRARIINAVIQANYPDGEDTAALRKGIVDATNAEFIAFNNFVEAIKAKCASEGVGEDISLTLDQVKAKLLKEFSVTINKFTLLATRARLINGSGNAQLEGLIAYTNQVRETTVTAINSFSDLKVAQRFRIRAEDVAAIEAQFQPFLF
ncbi:MAG TPA: hypothetical protein DCR40_10280 [Prolixibacteraceae bacterium]|nr:hypothetical protein [Prolixibacteraceae bacterium]